MADTYASLYIPDSDLFDEKRGYVQLIEVSSKGTSRRYVTDELVRQYIANDFQEALTTQKPEAVQPHTETLKFIYSNRQRDFDGFMRPIPLHATLFESIAPYARIATQYLEILSRNTAMHVKATPQLPESFSQASSRKACDEYFTFVIQSIPWTDVCVSASFTYHFPTRHMYIFMHGNENENYKRLSQTIEREAARISPFHIPSMIIEFNLERRLVALTHWHRRIKGCEIKLGVRDDEDAAIEPDRLDFVFLAKEVKASTTNIAFVEWSCSNTTRQLEFLDTLVEQYRELAGKNGFPEEEVDRVCRALAEKHEHLRCWNASIADRAEYLSKRGQALVQTVYSGIAQRDSMLQHKVALATSRDSAVMRVIAAITMIFLPGTFTATFFSTTFFDFGTNMNDSVYSSWLWLYWVVTLLLTAVVMTAAFLWWRSKENEITRRAFWDRFALMTRRTTWSGANIHPP